MSGFGRLLIVEDIKTLADADLRKHLDIDNDTHVKSLVYFIRSGGTSVLSNVATLPPHCEGSLGQLLILLYRWIPGKRCLVYSQEDVLTIMKMAQMKSGNEEVGWLGWGGGVSGSVGRW